MANGEMMRETDKYYFFWQHRFGQWTQREMIDSDGITYNCCEQYMMYQKAKLFHDEGAMQTILNETNPKAIKHLGREVKNYSELVWSMHRVPIVVHGNLLKFTQQEDLRELLLATGSKIICEASPFDKIWGIGLKWDDDRVLDINNWKGMNLLGISLMTVRDILREG
jgi:ribA/ribD-fused uncharacterized protein